MSASLLESLADALRPLAASDVVPLPPPPPAPKPVAPAKAAAPATEGQAAAAPTPAPAAPPPPPPEPIVLCDFASRGVHLEAVIRPECAMEAARILDRAGYAIDAVTGMDWMPQGLMEVIYDFVHFQSGLRVAVRARLPRDNPRIESIHTIFAGADWHERETHDMFGITFVGNPNQSPFLLPDDADYHPLRKDFKA